MTFKLDLKSNPYLVQNFCSKSDIYNLFLARFDYARPDTCLVNSNSFRLLVLLSDFKFSLKIIFVYDFDWHGLFVAQKALTEFEEVNWSYSYFGHKTLGFNWHGEHVLSNTFKVDNQNHVVDLREARHELNLNFGGFISFKSAFIFWKFELLLQRTTISRYSDRVVDIDFWCIGEVDCFVDWELVTDSAEVNNFVAEAEGRRDNMALESEGKHLGAAFERKPKCFAELAQNVGKERNLNQVALFFLHAKCSFIFAKFEFRAERGFVRNQLPVTVNFTGVFNSNLKGLLAGNKNVANVHLRNTELSLGAFAFPAEIQG